MIVMFYSQVMTQKKNDQDLSFGAYNVNSGMTLVGSWTPPKTWKAETVAARVASKAPEEATHFAVGGSMWKKIK